MRRTGYSILSFRDVRCRLAKAANSASVDGYTYKGRVVDLHLYTYIMREICVHFLEGASIHPSNFQPPPHSLEQSSERFISLSIAFLKSCCFILQTKSTHSMQPDRTVDYAAIGDVCSNNSVSYSSVTSECVTDCPESSRHYDKFRDNQVNCRLSPTLRPLDD